MFRVRLIMSAAAIASGAALAGCSGSSLSMPDWMSFSKPPPALQTVQFESQPPGADVRTAQGQTCQTPCSLAVPPESQVVSFSKPGFLPQTVQLAAGPPPEHSLFESPPPTLAPNPVEVMLQPAAPPPRKPAPKPKPHKVSSASPAYAGPPAQSSPFPPPPRQ
jgi:PEGA domain